MHAQLADATRRFGDPFASGHGSFHAWLAEGVGDSGVARLWHELWQRRPDLGAAFADPLGADRAGLERWAAQFAARELGIDEPMRDWPGAR